MLALFAEMHAVVRRIPRGKVVTYGQLAELAGIPGGARLAGAAMRQSRGLPWQRVLARAGARRGRIAIADPVGAATQRQRLMAEGVEVGDTGLVDLTRHGWMLSDPPALASRQRRPAKTGAPARQGSPRARTGRR